MRLEAGQRLVEVRLDNVLCDVGLRVGVEGVQLRAIRQSESEPSRMYR
jgi:hypothetical protein